MAAHLAALSRGADLTGPLLVLDHLFSLSLAGGLLALGVALGRFCLDRTGPVLTHPADVLAFGGAVGLGILSTLLLGLGLLGGLTPPLLVAVLLGIALLARKEVAGLGLLLSELSGVARRGLDERAPWMGLGLALFGLAAAFLLVFGAAPPTDWDSLMYHLQVPADFLAAGRVYLPPDNLHATVTGLVHMLYLPLLAAKAPSAPAILSALLCLVLAGAVGRNAGKWFGKDAGGLALTLFWGSTTVFLVAITPRTDVTLALFLFLGHVALLEAHQDGERVRQWVLLAAALLGMAVGVKFNALAYALGLAPLVIWLVYREGDGGRGIARDLSLAALVGGAFMAPWLLKNLVLVGAPFYPFLAGRLAEPWLDALFPGGSALAVVDPSVTRSMRSVQEGYNLLGPFFNPGPLNVEAEGAYYFANRAFLLLPLLVFCRRRSWMAWLLAPPLLYVAFTVSLTVPNLRYLIPAAPALTVALAGALPELRRRWAWDWGGTLGLVGICLLALFPTGKTVWSWVAGTRGVEHVLGVVSVEDYWLEYRDPGVRFYWPVVDFVNQNLGPENRVLLLFEARGFPLRTQVLQDNKISNWPIMAELLKDGGCLEEAGFDHVLVATAAVRYYLSRGLGEERLRWDEFEPYRARCLSDLFRSPGFLLYEVAPGTSGP